MLTDERATCRRCGDTGRCRPASPLSWSHSLLARTGDAGVSISLDSACKRVDDLMRASPSGRGSRQMPRKRRIWRKPLTPAYICAPVERDEGGSTDARSRKAVLGESRERGAIVISRKVVTAVVLLVLAGAVALPVPATAQTTAPIGALGVPAFSSFDPLDNGDPIQVRTLSSRADLVSGGDAFVEVVLPAGTDYERSEGDGGRPRRLRRLPPRRAGLARARRGSAARRRARSPRRCRAAVAPVSCVTNAPQGGPVFSGPLIQPWTCNNGIRGGRLQPGSDRRATTTSRPGGGGLQRTTREPARRRRHDDDRRGQRGSVHRPRGDRLQPARPVPDRGAVGPRRRRRRAAGSRPRPTRASPTSSCSRTAPAATPRTSPAAAPDVAPRGRAVAGLRRGVARARQRRPQLQHRHAGRVADHDEGDGRRALRPAPLHDRHRLLRRLARAAAGRQRLPRRVPGHHAAVQLHRRVELRAAVRRLRRPARVPRGPGDVPGAPDHPGAVAVDLRPRSTRRTRSPSRR